MNFNQSKPTIKSPDFKRQCHQKRQRNHEMSHKTPAKSQDV